MAPGMEILLGVTSIMGLGGAVLYAWVCRSIQIETEAFERGSTSSSTNKTKTIPLEFVRPNEIPTYPMPFEEFCKKELNVDIKEEIKKMNINDFAVKVSKIEGKKKQVNIAQIKEILKVVNNLLGGALYKLIRKL